MVLVKDKRNNILDPLSAVSGIIERRHTLPILSNVLIERTAQALSFLATDIEIQITARSALMAGGDPRAVTVGARKLVDILRALPEDTEVTLQQQDKRLLVKAGKSRFTLQTLPAEDFPRLARDRKSTRLNSSHRTISYAVFCLKKKPRQLQGTRDQRLNDRVPGPTYLNFRHSPPADIAVIRSSPILPMHRVHVLRTLVFNKFDH